jgi:uncharacterized RDD family membrane protein YckC
MSEQQYYVMTRETNQQVGPLGEREVRQWISERFLTSDDMIARAGDANWILINQSHFAPLMKTGSYPSVNRDMGRPQEYLQNINAQASAKPPVDSSLLPIRWVALMLDGLIAFPLIILAVLPIISLIGTPLVVAYFIFRDMLCGNGQSVGKKALGLKVVKSDDTPVTWMDSVKRNIVFFGYLALFAFTVPYLGWFVAIILMIPLNIVFLVETITVLVTGRRMGDHLGTTYVTRA